MARNKIAKDKIAKDKIAKDNMRCPISGKACITCAIYRGRHFNLCFNDHYRGISNKGTGPLISMGYPASALIVRRSM
jgi:hypothetical protein